MVYINIYINRDVVYDDNNHEAVTKVVNNSHLKAIKMPCGRGVSQPDP